MVTSATIRQVALSDDDIGLILSAMIYLKNMSEALAIESRELIAADREIIEQLEVLIKQFEEL